MGLTTGIDQGGCTILSDLEAVRVSVALPALRDRLLSNLKVGKQSSEYKRTKAVIDRFINELQYS